ncbi:MAG: hypothetical protein ACYDAQ_20235 [Mycobacteriales bacterium]
MKSEAAPRSERPGSLWTELVVPIVLVAVAALVGWLLLELVKGVIVTVGYAVGAALIVVPLLVGRRALARVQRPERWHRLGVLVSVAAVGVGLVVAAHLLSRDGWLLIAIPAGLVALSRLADRLARWRHRRGARAAA